MVIAARWLLVVPLGVLGTLIGFAVAIALVSAADALCPKELVVSGMCTAPWYPPAFSAASCAGAGVGGFATVSLASWVAPSRKRAVAALAFALGTAYAVWALSMTGRELLLPVVFAITAGIVALLKGARRFTGTA